MRVADLVEQYLKEGSTIFDVGGEADLASHLGLLPAEVTCRQLSFDELVDSATDLSSVDIVLDLLPSFDETSPQLDEAEASRLRAKLSASPVDATWVFFSDSPASLAAYPLQLFTESGHEIVNLVATRVGDLPYAIVVRRVAESTTSSLALRNEYRYNQYVVEDLRRQVARWEQRNQHVRNQMAKLRSEMAKLEQENGLLESLERELQAAAGKHQALVEENTRLRSDVVSLRATVGQRGSELELLRTKLRDLRGAVREYAESEDRLQSTVSELSRVSDDLRREARLARRRLGEERRRRREERRRHQEQRRQDQEEFRRRIVEERKRLHELKVAFRQTHNQLVSAETSSSYRFGHALVLALKNPKRDALAMPARMIRAFLERKDEADLMPPVPPPTLEEARAVPSPLANEPLEDIDPYEEPEDDRDEVPTKAAKPSDPHEDAKRAAFAGASAEPSDARLVVAGVVSRATATDLRPDCHLLWPSPNDWRFQLEATRPDFLLLETGVYGEAGPWSALGSPVYSDLERRMAEILDWCEDQEIPTVMWDNHREGMPRRLAPMLDRIDALFSATGRDLPRAFDPLPMGVQPREYNPIGQPRPRSETPLLVGGFDRRRSVAEVERLIAAAGPLGLAICDDRSDALRPGTGFPISEGLSWTPSPSGRVGRLLKAHRAVVLDRPDIDGHPVGHPRLLQVLASGADVIAWGWTSPEWSDHVRDEGPDLAESLAEATRSDEPGIAMALFRELMRGHTVRDSLNRIAQRLDLDKSAPAPPALTAIARIESTDGRELVDQVVQQTQPPAEMVWVHRDRPPSEEALARLAEAGTSVRTIRASHPDEAGQLLAGRASHELVALLSDSETYDPHFLEDALNVFTCVDTQVVNVVGDAETRSSNPGSFAPQSWGRVVARRSLLAQSGDRASWLRSGARVVTIGQEVDA